MSYAKPNTNPQLPTQSKYGVCMKTSAFHDPDTKQVSWRVANKMLSGSWQILECTTEMFGGDDPYVESKAFKKDVMFSYDQIIRELAEYEFIRKASGMLEAITDYPIIIDVPHYKEVAHTDGIIFDLDGNPHPTNKGSLLTEGRFATSEIKAVLESVSAGEDESHIKSLSRAFFQANVRDDQTLAQEVQNKQSELKDEAIAIRESREISDLCSFVGHVHTSMQNIRSSNYIYYQYEPKHSLKRFSLNMNLEDIFKVSRVMDVEIDHRFSWKEMNDHFSKVLKSVETNRAFSGSLKEETKEFLCYLRLMISATIIHAVFDGKKLLENYKHRADLEDIKTWNSIKEFICNHERTLMAMEIKRHFPKMSRKDRVIYLDRLCVIAMSNDFDKKYAEIKEAGDALLIRIKASAEKVKKNSQPALKAPAPKKP